MKEIKQYIGQETNTNSLTDTYIYNNNIGGEIIFIVNPNTYQNKTYYTRINSLGRLEVWYDYDATKPFVPANWYNVSQIISEYLFNVNAINIGMVAMTADAMILANRMTTAEAQILVLIDNGILVDSEVNLLTTFVEGELTDKLNLILENPAISDTLLNTPYFNSLPDTTTIFNAIQSKIIQSSTFSTLIQSLLITGVGIGYIGTIAGTITKNISEADRLTGYINQLQANSSIHLDLDHKRDLTTQASNLLIHNIHSYSSNTSNLIFQNGFIHSNSITDILSPYQTLANFTTTQGLTSNELGSQRFINSNSITNILGMKENSLTFSTPLNRIGNTISIDLTNYVTENTLTIYAAAAAASAAAAGASAVAAANYATTAGAEAAAAGAGAGEATASAATASSAVITCIASAGTAVAAAVTATGSESDFTELPDGEQITRLTSSDYPTFTKTLTNTQNQYNHIGFCFNTPVRAVSLNFIEIQLWGKEYLPFIYYNNNPVLLGTNTITEDQKNLNCLCETRYFPDISNFQNH
jgi:hypothetical protein